MRDFDPDDLKSIYKDARKRIEQRYDRRKEILIHTSTFFIAMTVVWAALIDPGDVGENLIASIAAFVSGGWLIGYIGHLIDFVFNELREQAVERELERYGLGYPNAKRKNRNFTRLSDDGELFDPEYDGEEDTASGRRR